MCVTQSNKLAKLESERQEWQRRIIETEREKRVSKQAHLNNFNNAIF